MHLSSLLLVLISLEGCAGLDKNEAMAQDAGAKSQPVRLLDASCSVSQVNPATATNPRATTYKVVTVAVKITPRHDYSTLVVAPELRPDPEDRERAPSVVPARMYLDKKVLVDARGGKTYSLEWSTTFNTNVSIATAINSLASMRSCELIVLDNERNGEVVATAPARFMFHGQAYTPPTAKTRVAPEASSLLPRPAWCTARAEWKLAKVPSYGTTVGACFDGDYVMYSGEWLLKGCLVSSMQSKLVTVCPR